jgi:hypothetical protein
MTQEFEFYSVSDMSEYSGKWVAILGKEVIASGDDLKKVYDEAKKKSGNREPLFARIPNEEEALIL